MALSAFVKDVDGFSVLVFGRLRAQGFRWLSCVCLGSWWL